MITGDDALRTCFKLLHYINIGDIGLPDIQRSFID